MSDTTINVEQELAEAQSRLAVVLPDTPMPMAFTVRSLALTIAQRHVGDSTVKEGNLYQQLKMDQKLGGPVSVDDVIKAALVFERYLWGEWSKGLAENAINATLTEAADVIERELDARRAAPTGDDENGDAVEAHAHAETDEDEAKHP